MIVLKSSLYLTTVLLFFVQGNELFAIQAPGQVPASELKQVVVKIEGRGRERELTLYRGKNDRRFWEDGFMSRNNFKKVLAMANVLELKGEREIVKRQRRGAGSPGRPNRAKGVEKIEVRIFVNLPAAEVVTLSGPQSAERVLGKIIKTSREWHKDVPLEDRATEPETKFSSIELPQGMAWAKPETDHRKIVRASKTLSYHPYNPREFIPPNVDYHGLVARVKHNGQWMPAYMDLNSKEVSWIDKNGKRHQSKNPDYELLQGKPNAYSNNGRHWLSGRLSEFPQDAKPIYQFTFRDKSILAYAVMVQLEDDAKSESQSNFAFGVTWENLNGVYLLPMKVGNQTTSAGLFKPESLKFRRSEPEFLILD